MPISTLLTVPPILTDEDRRVKKEKKRKRFSPVACMLFHWSRNIFVWTYASSLPHGFAPYDTLCCFDRASEKDEKDRGQVLLHIEVEVELVRMRPESYLVVLSLPLVFYPGLYQVLREHPSLQQELLVCFELVEHLLQ